MDVSLVVHNINDLHTYSVLYSMEDSLRLSTYILGDFRSRQVIGLNKLVSYFHSTITEMGGRPVSLTAINFFSMSPGW